MSGYRRTVTVDPTQEQVREVLRRPNIEQEPPDFYEGGLNLRGVDG